MARQFSDAEMQDLMNGKVPSDANAPVTQTTNAPEANDATQSFAKGAEKGLSFGLANKIGGVEAAVGSGLRKIAPQSVVDAADKAAGTDKDPNVNPFATTNSMAYGGVLGLIMNSMIAAGSKSKDESWSDTYARIRDVGATQDKTNMSNHPVAAISGEVLGSIAPMITGAGALGTVGRVGARAVGLGADAADATSIAGKVLQFGKGVIGGAAKGAATGAVESGAYGVASDDGGTVGDKAKAGGFGALIGTLAGGAVGGIKALKVAGALKAAKAAISPGDVPLTDQQAAVKAFQDAKIPNIDNFQDVKSYVMNIGDPNAQSTIDTIAKNLKIVATEKDPTAVSSAASTLENVLGSHSPTMGKIAGAVSDATSGTRPSAPIRGIKSIVNTTPSDTTSSILDLSGRPFTTPAPKVPLPGLPEPVDQGTISKVLDGLSNGVNKGAVPTASAVSGAVSDAGSSKGEAVDDKQKQLETDAVDKVIRDADLDSSTPNGQQKISQLDPPTADNNSDTGADGQVSDDVDGVKRVNGRLMLTTPSGQQVDVT